MPGLARPLVQGAGLPPELGLRADLGGQLQCQAEVLVAEVHVEAGSVVSLDHCPELALEDEAVPRRLADHLADRLARDAQAVGERHGLGQRRLIRQGDVVVEQLENVTAPRLAQAEDVRPHGAEDRLVRCDDVRRGADHDGQRAGLGAAHAAAHGRIDQPHVPLRAASRRATRARGADRAQVEDDVPGPGPRHQTGGGRGAEDRRLHRAGVRQAQQRHTRGAGERGQITRTRSPQRFEWSGRLRAQVEDRELVLPLDEKVRRHRTPHVASADEADVHGPLLRSE